MKMLIDKNIITITVPNMDSYIAPYTKCSKEVIQKSYVDTIGKTIDYGGKYKKVLSVEITEDTITIKLGECNEEI